MQSFVIFLNILIIFQSICLSTDGSSDVSVSCTTLMRGQFMCPHPKVDKINPYINPKTQQPFNCTNENKAKVLCLAAEGINCTESGSRLFYGDIPCRWTNGYHYETTLILSIFFGMFGVDRFYLGYPALGLFKFCTLGFLFIGQLVDVVLIATQTIGPADGSYYIIPFYGPRLEILRSDNETYRVAQGDWGSIQNEL